MENLAVSEKTDAKVEVTSTLVSLELSVELCEYIFAKKALEQLNDVKFWEAFIQEKGTAEFPAEKLKDAFFSQVLPKIGDFANSEEKLKYFEPLKTNNQVPVEEKKVEEDDQIEFKEQAETPAVEEAKPEEAENKTEEVKPCPGTPSAGTPRKRAVLEELAAAPSPKRTPNRPTPSPKGTPVKNL